PPRYHRWENPERGPDAIRLNFQRLSLSSQDREAEILTIFRQLGEGRACTVHDLVRQLQSQKKEVNRVLYKLHREGKLHKGGETPPLWRIAGPSAGRERSPPPGHSCGAVGPTGGSRGGERNFGGSGDTDPAMAETKEKICNYLLSVEESTALSLAKNIGFSRAKDVNAFLSALEKLGDVHKQNTNPPRWSLTARKRERMQMKLKANLVAPKNEPTPQDPTPQTGFPPSSLPPHPQETTRASPSGEESLENGQQLQGQGYESDSSDVEVALPGDTKPQFSSLSHYDNSENGRWATDDIPDNLNTMKKQEGGAIMNSQSTPSCTPQLEQPVLPCTPVEKLMACLEKNPVSGLTEYSQFTCQQCEFAMLEQSGPSHEPRFKFQVVISGRRFPPAEAGSKKLAKQEAAANAMRILMKEAENGSAYGVKNEEPPPSELEPPLQPEPEPSPAPAQLNLLPGKNPISVLMEYGQKSGNTIEFQLLSQDGPPHDPRFSYCVKMGDQIFPAVVGNSKKGAKQMAAEVAVKILSGDSVPQVLPEQPVLKPQGDPSMPSSGPWFPTLDEPQMSKAKGVGELLKYLNVNPVSGLLEYARSNGFAAEFKLIDQSGPPHDPKFVYQAKVGGRWFPAVTAHNKKQGKQEAADAALRVLIGEMEKMEHMEGINHPEVFPPLLSMIFWLQLPVSGSTLHDQLAMLSHQRFNSLTARIQHSLLGRKILAAIIMRRGTKGLGVVVSIGTGRR
ncbi:DSRAD deaminase, partial [Turnix velox]|nr:DSRAD deaminase [Turnix velox]